MQRVIHFRVLGALASDLANRMQHGGVIASTKKLADLRQTFLRELLGQLHRNLPWERNSDRTAFAVHVGDLDLVIVGNGFLNQFDCHLGG
jgi:hypothetical protein